MDNTITEKMKKWEHSAVVLKQYFIKSINDSSVDEDKKTTFNWDYDDVVAAVANYVFNLYGYNINVIEDGDYQGTKIYIIYKDTYDILFRDANSPVYVVSVDYGSCSICDTMMGIYDEFSSSKDKVEASNSLCKLALDIVRDWKTLEEFAREYLD